MRLLKQSFLALLLAAGTPFTCFAQSAAQSPILEYYQNLGRAINDARELKDDPWEALAKLEQMMEIEAPPDDFDNEDANLVILNYDIHTRLAHLYLDAARVADDGGYWEKAAEYFQKAGDVIREPAEKAKAAFARFGSNFEINLKSLQEIMEKDEFKALRAKKEEDYTNDDYTVLESMQWYENEIKANQGFFEFFKDRIAKVDTDVVRYNPERSLAEYMLEKVRDQQAQLDKYRKDGHGDRTKWVEGVVRSFGTKNDFMRNYTRQEDKIALTYRLLVLSPNSKTAPVLLEHLKGNATEAELKRAIQSATPAPRKKQ